MTSWLLAGSLHESQDCFLPSCDRGFWASVRDEKVAGESSTSFCSAWPWSLFLHPPLCQSWAARVFLMPENSAFVPKTRKAQRLGRVSGSREENASHGFQAPTATGNKIISVTTDFPARNISPCLFYKERNNAGHFSVRGLRNFRAQNEGTEPLGWLSRTLSYDT